MVIASLEIDSEIHCFSSSSSSSSSESSIRITNDRREHKLAPSDVRALGVRLVKVLTLAMIVVIRVTARNHTQLILVMREKASLKSAFPIARNGVGVRRRLCGRLFLIFVILFIRLRVKTRPFDIFADRVKECVEILVGMVTIASTACLVVGATIGADFSASVSKRAFLVIALLSQRNGLAHRRAVHVCSVESRVKLVSEHILDDEAMGYGVINFTQKSHRNHFYFVNKNEN